jgi:putative ABC transport system substrate-binding protein
VNARTRPVLGRRAFLRHAGAMVAVATLSSCASAPSTVKRIRRVGALNVQTPSRESFLAGLRESGYDEAAVEVDWRQSQDPLEESIYPIAAELVATPVDAIVANGTPAHLAARRATSTIPIVIVTGGDPVEAGLVESIGRPGGNVTGIMGLGGAEPSKRLELLKEAFPSISRVAIASDDTPARRLLRRTVEDAARALGIGVVTVEVHHASELPQALDAAARNGADALLVIVVAQPASGSDPHTLAFAAARRIPAAYGNRAYADAGGLLVFAVDYDLVFRRAGQYVARILSGETPAAMPVEVPTHFELIVNLKTAREQGLTIPQSVLIRATRVIE